MPALRQPGEGRHVSAVPVRSILLVARARQPVRRRALRRRPGAAARHGQQPPRRDVGGVRTSSDGLTRTDRARAPRMRALATIPGTANSVRLVDVDQPAGDGAVLAQTLAIGVCGTDIEIIDGHYGWAPAGRQQLILGHESIARVISAPEDSGLGAGDLIAGIVR